MCVSISVVCSIYIMCTHTHTGTHTHTHSRRHAHAHSRRHAHTHTHVYIHTHTHTGVGECSVRLIAMLNLIHAPLITKRKVDKCSLGTILLSQHPNCPKYELNRLSYFSRLSVYFFVLLFVVKIIIIICYFICMIILKHV